MGEPVRILVAGGSGVFGRHLARELLAHTDARLVLAGRDAVRLEATRQELGSIDRTEAAALDLHDLEDLERAAKGCLAVACTAGPFQVLPLGLPSAAVRAGAHWVDIADAPAWVLPLLHDAALGREALDAGVAVMPGLSTVPAVSGVLARWCRERLAGARHGRVTLFIGNRNQKGTGATASALIGGFADPAPVDLPIGRRLAYHFATPDAELFRADLGLDAEFRVALEWAWLGRSSAALGRLARMLGPRRTTAFAGSLSRVSRPFARFGTERGIVQVELWNGDARRVTASAVAGQRLVILPCALALESLLRGDLTASGVIHPAEWRPHDQLIADLQRRGVAILTRGASLS